VITCRTGQKSSGATRRSTRSWGVGMRTIPSPGEVLASIDEALAGLDGWLQGRSRTVYRELIIGAYGRISKPLEGHSKAVSTTNLWHLRGEFLDHVGSEFGSASARLAEAAIGRAITCYAAKLHLNKAHSLINPTRGVNPGYAPFFERVTRFEGRVWQMAGKRHLRGVNDPDKPWLDDLPRLIFVSDMGDAFSRDSDFSFLETEVIEPIRSPEGQRHFWLWLTKRPDRMAKFGERIGGFPKNVCAMTTITGPGASSERARTIAEVPASVRGLSRWNRSGKDPS